MLILLASKQTVIFKNNLKVHIYTDLNKKLKIG